MKCCPLTAGFAVCWCGGNWPTLDEDLSLGGFSKGGTASADTVTGLIATALTY